MLFDRNTSISLKYAMTHFFPSLSKIAMPSPYSPTQLEFLRYLAESNTKESAWYNNWNDLKGNVSNLGQGALNVVGDGGWGWDTGQNVAGNFSGYGGLIGNLLGTAGGAVAGSAAMPVAGTAAGGIAGGVAGGAAGRGLGHALGQGIDWIMGNKPGLSQMKQTTDADGTLRHIPKSWAETTFDPGAMIGDGVFGLLPGIGKGLQTVGRGIFGTGKQALGKHLTRTLGHEATGQTIQKFQNRLGRWGTAKAVGRGETNDQIARWGMTPFCSQSGQSLVQQGFGRLRNFAKNTGRMPTSRAGLTGLAREGTNFAKWGIPLHALGGATNQLQNSRSLPSQSKNSPFTNTQGFTQVVGNRNKGFSGVQTIPSKLKSLPKPNTI